MNTSRISSGFDIELQLGAGWFRTAIELLNEKGLLAPPGTVVVITDVRISFEPGWDLEIDLAGIPFPVFARAELSSSGDSLTLTTNFPQIDPKTIPFSVLDNLAGVPQLIKREGDAEHEHAIILLANLAINAEPQNENPGDPVLEPVERGNADDAVSFLPLGKHVAFGFSRDTFGRFANNLWHTQLRAENGSHPLPDEENKAGEWSRVTITGNNGKIKIKLEGDVPVDSPIIDIVPDPHVTITLTLTPIIENGLLTFSIDPDTDIDTGLLGNIFGAVTGAVGGGILGGIIGFIVGLVTGGLLATVLAGIFIGAGIGLVAGIIIIEIAEVIAEGKVQKTIKAKINGEELPDITCSKNGVVQIAKPDPEEGFNISILDSIPSSIPVHSEKPEDEFLYTQNLLVTSVFDDFTADNGGFAVCGMSGTDERFQPDAVSVKSFNYNVDDELESIMYTTSNGDEQTLSIEEVIDRTSNGELIPPIKIFTRPQNSTLRIPEGKLACVTLTPVAIHRDDTVVTEIEFEGGIKLKVEDAVFLQDNAAIVVVGYQLIHPKDYNPYYRAKADFFKDNNFESLPEF